MFELELRSQLTLVTWPGLQRDACCSSRTVCYQIPVAATVPLHTIIRQEPIIEKEAFLEARRCGTCRRATAAVLGACQGAGLLIFLQCYLPKHAPVTKGQRSLHPVPGDFKEPDSPGCSRFQGVLLTVLVPRSGTHRDRFPIDDFVSSNNDAIRPVRRVADGVHDGFVTARWGIRNANRLSTAGAYNQRPFWRHQARTKNGHGAHCYCHANTNGKALRH